MKTEEEGEYKRRGRNNDMNNDVFITKLTKGQKWKCIPFLVHTNSIITDILLDVHTLVYGQPLRSYFFPGGWEGGILVCMHSSRNVAC